jgi:poly(hydroxyalkanoate) depolymerase family esterase
MNALSHINMNEVARLTREGRLLEATSILQRELCGASGPLSPSDNADRSDRDPHEGVQPRIGMVRHQAAESAWIAQMSRPPTSEPLEALGVFPAPELTRSLEPMEKLGAVYGLALEPLPSGASFNMHSVGNAAGTMRYKLYVPSGHTGQALPLIVMLHGCTQSPDDFAAGTRMNKLAEELLFLVAYPEQTKAANASKCWNWFKPGDQQRGRGEPSLIASITRQIISEFSVDPGRVFVAGLSAGGAAAAIMGHEYPDLYRGVGVHSGLACGSAKDMPSAFAAMRCAPKGKVRRSKFAIPTIVFHGDGDKTVSPANADQVVEQFKSDANTVGNISHGLSAGGIAFTRRVETNDAGDAVLEWWTLHGAGHAWSGGSRRGSYTDPRGPDASREMVRFFLQLR